ncbi:MAG: ABC transporter ATP-binding protein [bacterium]|nr:ABC transporter ATP-binding protein [bacterium]
MNSIFRIIKIARPFHKLIYILSLLILVSSLIDVSASVLIKFVIDELERQLTTGSGSLAKAVNLLALMFALNTISVIIEAVSLRIGDYTNGRIGKYLTEKFYKKIFTLSQSYFDSEISGKIVNQLSRGIASLSDFLGAMTNFIVPAFVQTIFTLVVLAYFDITIALLALGLFPLYIIISHYSTKKWGEHQVKRNKIEDITRGRIQEVISNIRLVKSYGAQANEYNFISFQMGKSIKIYDQQSLIYHILNFLRNFSLEAALIGVVFIVFRQTFLGLMTFGELVLIFQLLNRLRRPLFAMSFILERVKQAETGSKEYFKILDLESAEEFKLDIDKNDSKIILKPTVEFKDVSFDYSKGRDVLKNVSFSATGPETVALVGHSGAGKTTITNLILKFYEPTKGKLRLNGTDYNKLTHAQIRQQVSLVFQDSELFSTTIRENVAYGMPSAQDRDIEVALKQANAWEFVKEFPDKLDEQIGERGVKLSGGQKQRIQIARAILANRPILILDEATSSLDAKSEKFVQNALDKLMENKLVLIIAHRFSTLQNANRVIVLDKGKVVNVGQPGELARGKGIYAELLRYQIEGNQKLLEKYDLSA